jgi:hypothetical protein
MASQIASDIQVVTSGSYITRRKITLTVIFELVQQPAQPENKTHQHHLCLEECGAPA